MTGTQCKLSFRKKKSEKNQHIALTKAHSTARKINANIKDSKNMGGCLFVNEIN